MNKKEIVVDKKVFLKIALHESKYYYAPVLGYLVGSGSSSVSRITVNLQSYPADQVFIGSYRRSFPHMSFCANRTYLRNEWRDCKALSHEKSLVSMMRWMIVVGIGREAVLGLEPCCRSLFCQR
jgi:hypothetical protein